MAGCTVRNTEWKNFKNQKPSCRLKIKKNTKLWVHSKQPFLRAPGNHYKQIILNLSMI